MELLNAVVVITGAASGIGRALAIRCAQESLAGLILADVDESGVKLLAAALGENVVATTADVRDSAAVEGLVALATLRFGRVDIFFSNAGIFVQGPDATNEEWQRIWEVNVMAHVYAARAALPGMLERGHGYLVNTVSAAGLLTQLNSAPYSTTKHAAIGYAEWLSVTYGDRGIRVSVLCPQGVATRMLFADGADAGFLAQSALTPEAVADTAIAGLCEEKFLILPHPEVLEYYRRKGSDYDRWLSGMRRLKAKTAG
ncbi:3-phenylpropionate-dihydrodiol/cinnamic acid-dihydrodiol dehydrogenase [Paraburkholderia domus]|uniref:SDR family oxidoreductase n=1 Tax=Paraburkholderia domus TaxID=2793075 RepID=UPI001912717F|nr:SDR family oxidoreductase [Paraburkholderia domus]MBK5091722.1 SDR family oxidoreductase [Burkholderia sp. R-69927]CAE6941346.1 3-phenylpropionate-dihydrodiol/cinnamic acid-dihydrodiol dehydrogenase [Paraburkholderia domus]